MRAAVALGGAIGSVGRVGLALAWPAATAWVTWAELTVNVTGAFLLAVLVERVEDPLWRAGLGTGLLGSWTTVSAFMGGAADRVLGEEALGWVYPAHTVVLGVAAAWVGRRLATRPMATA